VKHLRKECATVRGYIRAPLAKMDGELADNTQAEDTEFLEVE
jgi:hypothetical protein